MLYCKQMLPLEWFCRWFEVGVELVHKVAQGRLQHPAHKCRCQLAYPQIRGIHFVKIKGNLDLGLADANRLFAYGPSGDTPDINKKHL